MLIQSVITAANGMAFLTTPPSPAPGGDGLRPGLTAEQVTPGFLGFAMTAFMVIGVVLLMVSMTRRIRRVRYREQVSTSREALEQQSPDEGHEGPAGADISQPGTPRPPI